MVRAPPTPPARASLTASGPGGMPAQPRPGPARTLLPARRPHGVRQLRLGFPSLLRLPCESSSWPAQCCPLSGSLSCVPQPWGLRKWGRLRTQGAAQWVTRPLFPAPEAGPGKATGSQCGAQAAAAHSACLLCCSSQTSKCFFPSASPSRKPTMITSPSRAEDWREKHGVDFLYFWPVISCFPVLFLSRKDLKSGTCAFL